MSNYEIAKLAFYVIATPIWWYLSLAFIGRKFAEWGREDLFAFQLDFLEKKWGYFVAFVGVVCIAMATVEGSSSQAFSCALLTAWYLLTYNKVIDRVRSKLALVA